MTDNVNHPKHYTGRNIGHECIDITQYQTFCTGNVIKYLWRYNDKGTPLEDLRKARWYARRASMMQETVNTALGQSGDILLAIITVTSGYESAAWVGILQRKWDIVLSALDMMIKEYENDTKAH